MGSCSPRWQELLSADLDGELDAHEQRELARHLATCTGCVAEQQAYAALRGKLQEEASQAEPVSPHLRARVTRLAARPGLRVSRRMLGGLVAGFAAAVLLWGSWPVGMSEALAMDLERHHLKAFSRSAPCEFESDDPERVKAWVEEVLGYPVQVPAVPGATLLGARRCRLHGQLSASLLYRVGDRALTVFLPPRDSSAGREAAAFAEGGVRCLSGPLGEQICVRSDDAAGAAMAVSETEASFLVAVLEQLDGS